MRKGATNPRIKCPVVLSATRSGGAGDGTKCSIDFSLINLFDEFSQPTIPYFRYQIDFSKIHALLDELDKKVDSTSNERLRHFGRLLWNLLIPPEIRDYLSILGQEYAIQLLVMTNDMTIPWEIIHDDQDFWALKYTMGRIYGSNRGNVTTPRRGKKRCHRPPLLLIYDPAHNLKGAKREGEELVRALRDSFSIKPLTGRLSAYELALEIGSDEYDLIHFAGHAVMGKRSGLVTSERELYSEEISRYSLSRNPVVFANACSSGTHGYYGAKTLTIAEAFIAAGAAAFIGTLWRTSDNISAQFASAMYSQLKTGCTVGDAILSARKHLYANPLRQDIDWAAFALFGNPDSRLYTPVMREGVDIRQVQITMSNARGTLAHVLLALSRLDVNIVRGRSITLDDERTAGYIAEMEVPTNTSELLLRNRLFGSLPAKTVHSLRYLH